MCLIIFLVAAVFMPLSQARIIPMLRQECEQYALSHSPALQAGILGSSKAGLQVWQAVSGMLPQATLAGYRTYNHKLGEMVVDLPTIGPQRLKLGMSDNMGGGLSVTQTLFSGGAVLSRYKISQYSHRLEQQKVEDQKNQLVFTVRTYYYQILLLDKLLQVQQQSAARAAENLRSVNLLFQSGGANTFEKLRAEVEYANTQPTLLNLRNNLSITHLELKKLIGVPLSDSIVLVDTLGLISTIRDQSLNLNLDSLKNSALQNRPDLKQLYWTKQIAGKNIWLSTSNFLPKLSYTYSNSYQAISNHMDMMNIAGDDWINSSSSQFSLSIPIFTGFRNSSIYLESRLNRAQVNYYYEEKEKQVMVEVEKAVNSFRVAEENLTTYQKTLEQARESYRQADLLYQQQGASQLDLITAQLGLTQSEGQYYQGIVNLNLAYHQLQLSIGTMD